MPRKKSTPTVTVHCPARTGKAEWSGTIQVEGVEIEVVDSIAEVPVELIGDVLAGVHGATIVKET